MTDSAIPHNPGPAETSAKLFGGAAAILVLTLIAYLPAFNAKFIWDDDYYVTNNTLLRNWEGLQRIWLDVFPRPSEYPLPQYYPMTFTSFWLEYRLWGLNPTGYHVVNILLHACNALLVWLILRKLAVPGAWLAAAIFAVHPINVESVAWVAERKNVLSLLFFLTSLYVYLRFARVIGGAHDERPESPDEVVLFALPNDSQRLYALAAVLFLFALFSKTVTSSMPAVALLIIIWKRNAKLSITRDLLPLIPLFIAGTAMGALTAFMEKYRVGVAARPEQWHYAASPLGEFGARCIIAGKALWFYIGKALFPHPLIFNYMRWPVDAGSALQYVPFTLAILALLAVFVLRKRLGGGGTVVAVLVYVGTLFPALGFLNVWPMQYSFVADHFAYISLIAIFAVIAAMLTRRLSKDVLYGVSGVIVAFCVLLSIQHSIVLRDNKTLWERTLEQTGQRSWFAANEYGLLLLDRGEVNAAEKWFEKVIRLKPDHPEARLNLARIALYRAERESRQERQAAATTTTTTATTSPSERAPTTTPAEYRAQAIAFYEDAIAQQPNFVDAHFFLAELLLSMGQIDRAKAEYAKAIEYYPRHALAHMRLGQLAMKDNDTKAAIGHFVRAAEIDPDSVDAHLQLGTALLAQGNLSDGLDQWEQSMQLAPRDPSLPNRFGEWMAESGEMNKAIDYFRRALSIDPQYVPAMTNLGLMAARAGYPDQARKNFEDALKIDPKYTPAKELIKALEEGRIKPTTKPSTRPATAPDRASQ